LIAILAAAAWVTVSTAELGQKYDTLWAVSDVHGHLEELDQLLLAAGLAVRDGSGEIAWNPARPRQLFVAVGDYIDGGRDSVGVVLRLRGLSAQAAAAGSRVVALLGNHEVAFLAQPESAERRLLASAHRAAKELGLRSRPSGRELADSQLGDFLRSLPAVASIGTWLFAHSGWLSGPGPDLSTWQALLDRRSIVSCHDWWRGKQRRHVEKERLAELGLTGLVFGHDPDAFGFPGAIALDSGGRFIKLDTGMKNGHSRGMLLRCDVSKIPRQAMGQACAALGPDGGVHALRQ
jgi:Calcineurin-like phosphoesterase